MSPHINLLLVMLLCVKIHHLIRKLCALGCFFDGLTDGLGELGGIRNSSESPR